MVRCSHYYEVVVFLFNSVIYISVLLCLCFCIVTYVLYGVIIFVG